MTTTASTSEWATKKVDGGYVVTFRGKVPYPMPPKETRLEARGYMERLQHRYPEDSVLILWGTSGSKRQRGGPWRYVLANGEEGVIHESRLDDAKSVLRHRLHRKTLPRGTVFSLEV